MRQDQLLKTKVGLYNMVPNLFWSALLLVPACVFCYSEMESKVFWIFFSVSVLAMLLPRSFFDRIQLSTGSKVYKKIGVGFINKFTQNGDIINSIIRSRYPGYKVVSTKDIDVKRLIAQTYVFEKFHFMLFVFFVLTMVYAIVEGRYGWAIIFLISNIVYNVYPCFLQQYIRIRLRLASKRMK